MKLITKILSGLVLAAASALGAQAQTVGLKTNLINDALLSPNIGIEIGLAPKWTLDIVGEGNFWTVKSRTWKHVYAQPELRYWLCQRFAGHFFGVHALGGIYNFGNLDLNYNFLGSDLRELKNQRYQGWAAGAGIAYGYAWPVHKHWNVEAELGIGWLYTRYDGYPCTVCGTKFADNLSHNYFGLTKLALNIVYLF